MMEEELSLHEVEGEVMKEPAEDGDTDGPIVVSPRCYVLKGF
jgi:hypothetical protein